MSRPASRRLVVDASVVRSAGGEGAVHPVAKRCRDFLLTVLFACHRMVVTPDIEDEWKRHRSAFASKWRYSMYAKKKVVYLADCRDENLRQKILAVTRDDPRSDALMEILDKDVHLVEAAIATDKVIFSLDEVAKAAFRRVAASFALVRPVLWVNPSDASHEAATTWLTTGGGQPDLWRLGSQGRRRGGRPVG